MLGQQLKSGLGQGSDKESQDDDGISDEVVNWGYIESDKKQFTLKRLPIWGVSVQTG